MNDRASLTSEFVRMLTDMYERAHIAAALLDKEFRLAWWSTQALAIWPLLAHANGVDSLLDGLAPASIRSEISHCGFFHTPGGTDNLFAEHPGIIYAAPPECGGYYLLHPAADGRPAATTESGLHPIGLTRSLTSFESHYRIPISSIFSTLSVLRQELDRKHLNSNLTPYLESLQSNAFDLLRNTQMVSEYTRLSNGMLPLNLVRIELCLFLRTLLHDADVLTKTCSIPLHFELPARACETLCDADRFNAVLLNLLSNACRFTRPDNQICVQLHHTETLFILSVCDKGLGIPSHVLPHVFDPYYSYSSGGEPFAGNGLGLAIAQKSAALLGGTLALTSIEGEGTTATFSFPLRAPASHALASPPPLRSAPPAYLHDRFSPLRIMLSDSVRFPL